MPEPETDEAGPSQEKRDELLTKLKSFLRKHEKEFLRAANEKRAFAVDLSEIEKMSHAFVEMLEEQPHAIFEIAEDAAKETVRVEIPEGEGGEAAPVKIRFFNLPETTNIRDLRSKHIGKFLSVEGIVRRSSEIRPDVVSTSWECPECKKIMDLPSRLGFIQKPFQCDECGNKRGLKQRGKKLIDTRWITIEEPFELTEGEKPCQLTIVLSEDLTSRDGRRLTDPGNRIKVTGMLKDRPREKEKPSLSALDFYFEANFVEPTDIGWEKLEISREDEEKIRQLAKDENIYKKLVGSLAPSLYGMEEIKESIILQLFSGVPRSMKDGTKIRGEIHILLIGDPASGKTQLMKLVPQIVPRGKYVSGKGVTTAGLTATVIKDEQFLGGWVLEAGAVVLANKGLLSVDEFEKMNPDDQVAMHEAMESGSVSIAKASIVATLPAQTSILAGGNPVLGRFDDAMSMKDQIKIPPTLLTRFDLKYVLKDEPSSEKDTKIVEHILRTREDMNYEGAQPKIGPDIVRKYIAYAKNRIKPEIAPETGKMLQDFYVGIRKRAGAEGNTIPFTLRQFEALIRLAEASAKIQLSEKIRKQDVERAIRLMEISLRQLGYDIATGTIDIDKAEGGVSSTERSRMKAVINIINALSEKEKEIKTEKIVELAIREGVENAEEIVEKLKRDGMLYSPSPGFVQKV